MSMKSGFPIPGSKFYEIFRDNTNYWGYVADTIEEATFELRAEKQTQVNKIYLSTTHDIPVKLYIKPDFDLRV